jgi:hypothetical protein
MPRWRVVSSYVFVSRAFCAILKQNFSLPLVTLVKTTTSAVVLSSVGTEHLPNICSENKTYKKVLSTGNLRMCRSEYVLITFSVIENVIVSSSLLNVTCIDNDYICLKKYHGTPPWTLYPSKLQAIPRAFYSSTFYFQTPSICGFH